jgi:hypothetical protein
MLEIVFLKLVKNTLLMWRFFYRGVFVCIQARSFSSDGVAVSVFGCLNCHDAT